MQERNGPVSPNSPAKTPTSTSSGKGDNSKSGISRPPSATPSQKSTKSRSTSKNRLLLKTPEPEPPKKGNFILLEFIYFSFYIFRR